jgi:hypothetical protein
LLTSSLLSAQTVVTFPSDHANIANGSTSVSNFPYSSGVSRTMAVYESWDLLVPNGTPITRIGFRRDGTASLTARSLMLEVRMGTTAHTAASLGSNFDNNYSSPPTTVFGPALYSLPTITGSPGGQQIWLTLTTPYVFNAASNLLVEWRITANSNGNASFSYALDRGTFDSPLVSGPVGCPSSGGQTPDLQSTRAAIGQNWRLSLTHAPASSLTFWLATVNSPLVSPYPLASIVPGIAPACTGQIDLGSVAVVNVLTSGSGAYTWNIPVPNERVRWHDAIIASQCASLDLFAPGGVVVSNGDQIQFGIVPANSIIIGAGNASAATGTVTRNHGIVTLFEY